MRKTATTEAGGVPPGTLMALMFAVFAVAAGYGLLLPLLPFPIERLLGPGATGGMISRHTGSLTSVYTLAIFLFAHSGAGFPIGMAGAAFLFLDCSGSARACWSFP